MHRSEPPPRAHASLQALRGAAPSYGLVTSFYFTTFTMPSVVINFSYTWKGLSVDVATSVFSKFQAFGASHAPAELGIHCTIKPRRQIQISGIYHGTMDNFHNTMVCLSRFSAVSECATDSQSSGHLCRELPVQLHSRREPVHVDPELEQCFWRAAAQHDRPQGLRGFRRAAEARPRADHA